MKSVIYVILLFSFVNISTEQLQSNSSIVAHGDTPSIKLCRRSDPKLGECIINSINHLKPLLATGDLGPGLQIPPQEPSKIDDIYIGESDGIQIVLTNVTIHGTSQFHIQKLRANMQDLKMDAILLYPKLEMTGHFQFRANLFGRTVTNDGEVVIKIINSVNRITIKMQKFIKNGKEYIKFEDVSIKIKSSKPSSVELKGIFGSKTLNEIAGALVRENPLFKSDRMNPYFEKSLSQTMTKVANQIVSTATFDETFPL